jgi:hypothetical protein
MILPEKPAPRREFALEIGRQCAVSRPTRQAYHRELRSWYVTGAAGGDRAIYNKLKTHVRQAAAYLFQSESVRFDPVLPTRYGDAFELELEAIREDFHRTWHDSGSGLTVATGVRWAYVYPSVIWKVTAQGGQASVTLVPDPADICVLEEDRPFGRQEALAHFFYLDMAQIQRLLKGHPREATLLGKARAWSEIGVGTDVAGGASPLMVFDNVGDPLSGGGALVQGPTLVEAMVEAPRILCAELWIVDDRIHDWRVLTCLAPQGEIADVIWDRRTPGLSGIDPFVQLTLDAPPDYCWGFSEVDDLSGLQEWRERRMRQIDQLLELQLDSPMFLSGFGGNAEEKAKRLRMPGGTMSSPMPGAKAERLAPPMPPEAFAEVDAIDKQFADQGGLPLLLQGGGEPGIRAGNQVGVMATLASARLRETAMRVEHAVSEIATLMWRIHRTLDDEPLRKADGTRFLLTETPRDLVMLVSSHSASPLYAAAIKAEADNLLKSGAIGLEDYVTMKDPPNADGLRAKARKLQAAKAQQAQRLLAIKEMAATHGRTSRR